VVGRARVVCLGLCIVGAGALGAASSAARTPVYRSPGYRGTHRIPLVRALPPPPPLVLGVGSDPHVLVDAAGTGHIGWTEGKIGIVPSALRYCHLSRGQRACLAQASLVPPEPGPEFFPGNNPNLNDRIAVTVAGVSRLGRQGPQRRARAR
jgi:hypothetical protein